MKRVMVVLGLVITFTADGGAQEMGPISHEGIVDASLDRVWAAFTTSDGLRSWLAPNAEIDLRVGGLMRTTRTIRASPAWSNFPAGRVLSSPSNAARD
jgi:hypothetical protein